MNQRLPYEPESNESLKTRLSKALSRTWIVPNDPKEIEKMNRPGQTRECVFDFECGLRLIISKDQLYGSAEPAKIHISASAFNEDVFKNFHTIKELTRFIQGYYELIEGKGQIKFIGFSPGIVPHWIVDIEH